MCSSVPSRDKRTSESNVVTIDVVVVVIIVHSVQPLSSPPFLIHPPHSWYPPQSPEMLIPPLTGTGKGHACPQFTECLEVKILYGVHYF